MGTKIRVIIGVLVIIGMMFWAFNQIRERSYNGSKIAFEVGQGSVVVNNRGQESIPVEMRSNGRTSNFRIESADLGLQEASKRSSIGRTSFHTIRFDLPPGQAKIDVTRGGNVLFISASSQRIEAVVTPLTSEGVRATLIFTGVVILGALYYISRTLEHRWIWRLRDGIVKRMERPQGSAV